MVFVADVVVCAAVREESSECGCLALDVVTLNSTGWNEDSVRLVNDHFSFKLRSLGGHLID